MKKPTHATLPPYAKLGQNGQDYGQEYKGIKNLGGKMPKSKKRQKKTKGKNKKWNGEKSPQITIKIISRYHPSMVVRRPSNLVRYRHGGYNEVFPLPLFFMGQEKRSHRIKMGRVIEFPRRQR